MATRKTASKTPAAAAGKGTAKSATKKASKSAGKTAAPSKREDPAPPKPRSAAAVSPPAPAPASLGRASVPAGEARYRWIAHAAYLRAEKRGFEPGREVDDWLAAEAEFLTAYGVPRN